MERRAVRPLGDRGQHRAGRRQGVLAEVVLADVEGVEAELLGEDPEVDELPEPLGLTHPPARGRVGQPVAEGHEADLHHVKVTIRAETSRSARRTAVLG